jgi:hypothetical protein
VTNGADEADLVHVFTPDMEPIRTLVPYPSGVRMRGEATNAAESRCRVLVRSPSPISTIIEF